MKKLFSRLFEDMSPQAQSVFWMLLVFPIAYVIVFGMYLFLFIQTGDWQLLVLTIVVVVLIVVAVIALYLNRLGKGTLAASLDLAAMMLILPVTSVLLSGGIGIVLGIVIIAVSSSVSSMVMSRKHIIWAIATGVVSGLTSILLDLFWPFSRVSSPTLNIFVAVIAIFSTVAFTLFIIRQLWTSGRLRNRIIALMIVVLVPVLILYSYISVRAQQQDLEQALLDKTKTSAIAGATAIGTSLEDAIASGELTTEQVFDQNYVKFFTFDPSKYPELKDDPRIYDKYHTAYDSFADEHWQKIFDSYLTDQDITFATAGDINGYVPTHNKIFSTGDGNPATDRTKRIFNDARTNNASRNTEPFLQQVYLQSGTGATLWDVSAPIFVNGRHWGAFRIGSQLAQNQIRVQAATSRAVVSSFILLALVVVFAWVLGSYITNPIERLTKASQEAASGNLETHIDIPNRDEITILANAFNSMTAQIREFIGTLEERVAERTQSLELAAEVGRSVSQVRALDVMLKDAAELIRSRFDLYYVQVYLTDPGQANLILQSGTGAVGAELVGRGHRLPLNTTSINGRAAIEKKSVVISDTAASATFRPNPLLPGTRSEMAVPLLIGERVVGVLDMQSQHANALNQDILSAFEALAGQLAIAIQNATFLAEMQQARAEVEAQARRLSHANWVDYLDAIHKPEQIGFMFQGDQVTSLTETEQPESVSGEDTLAAPISVSGEKLGALVVEMEEQKRSSQMEQLIFAVARQVSQQIENLRLLESAERYRFEAEQASRSITREGWKNYSDANTGASLSYFYDLKEVRPFNQAGDQQTEESAISLPLKVRDETIGKLVVQGLGADDSEALELANLVSERLSAHIENLRLSEQTQERAQRERALRQITSAVRGSTDPATILRAAVRELGTLLGRKTVIRLETTDQASQSHNPTDLVGDSAATSGNEPVPPAEAPIADGGDE
jgi:GAF domain-containing protein/HAMP domain-containing protein